MSEDAQTPSVGGSSTRPTVHLVEGGGQGGIYHHTIAIGRALRDAGVPVVVHTATDAEPLDDGLEKCLCVSWSRRLPRGLRQATTAARFVAKTIPHLVRVGHADDLIHVQGLLGNQLTALLIWRLQRRGRPIAFSPHNTFARSLRRVDDATLRWMARRAGVVITFSADDQRRAVGWGATVASADLVLYAPTPSTAELATWNARFAQRPVAVLAGQVRADKRPDVFVAACRAAEVIPAIVGPTNDGEHLIRDATDAGDVIRVDGYVPLESFVAAVATCDVVVATHAIGSVSGPLAYARELGVRSVGPDIGGLGESVTVAVRGTAATDFAEAIGAALESEAPDPVNFASVAGDQLAAYRLTGWDPT